MPTATKKQPLHLAKNVGELNKMASDVPRVTNARIFLKTAEQLFKKGEASVLGGDEEMAYVMYMRYFNIISAIKKTNEYKKNEKYFKEMIGTKNSVQAIDQAEKLSQSLKDRYDEREAEQVSKKLELLSLEKEKEKKSSPVEDEKEKTDSEKKDGKPEKETTEEGQGDGRDGKVNGLPPTTPGFIDVHELYSILTASAESILFMDVRPEEQFENSRINHHNSINVPSDIIPPGTTVTYIEKALPEASQTLWKDRASMDHIVLLDWRCDANSLTPGTTLASLKDALYKWDPYARLKSEPRILTGGYEELLNYYPMLSTNANVPRPAGYNDVKMTTASLDTIAYDLDLAFLSSPEKDDEKTERKSKLETLRDELALGDEDRLQPESQVPLPRIDRTLKPKIGSDLNNANNRTPTGNIDSLKGGKSINLNIKNNVNQENMTKVDYKKVSVTEALSKNNENVTDVNAKLRETTSQEKTVPSSIPPSPKVVNIPSVNRNLKPKVDPSQTMVSPTEAAEDLEEAHRIRRIKQKSYEQFRAENQALIEERRARIAVLKSEEKKLETLEQLKKKELAETADLMRQKRRIEKELQALQTEKTKAEREENTRREELEQLQEEENKKRQLKEEADALRALKKRNEADEESQSRGPSSRNDSPVHIDKKTASEIEGQEETSRAEALAREQAQRERRNREAKEIEHRQAEQERKEKKEQVRQAQEMEREKQREAERKRLHKDRVETEKIDRENKRLEYQAADEAALASPGLPVGWQKILDPITGLYKYIDHTSRPKTVHTVPPDILGSPRRLPPTAVAPSPTSRKPGTPKPVEPGTPEIRGGVYKMKLRDEPETPRSGGMRRSHSSPNIAQMATDEDRMEPIRPHMPSVERGIKPRSPRPEMIPARSEVSAAKVRNLQPTWGNVGRGLTGLRNLGNTCYMNSTIQCLSNSTFLTTYFLRDNYRMDINRENLLGKKGEVAEEFAVLIKALWTGQYRAINPRDFKMMMAKHHPMFAGYDQQDAQEMLLFLLDSLHEDLNKVRKRPRLPEQDNDGLPDNMAADRAWAVHKKLNDSIIVDLFQGQFMSTLMCMKCERKSVTFDSFMYLTVPIPSNSRCTLRDCLLHFAKEEKMSGDSQWYCPGCKCSRDAIKRIVIWRLPHILLIHLKRFYYQGMWRQKINAHVDFPLDGLDLSKSIRGPQKRPPYQLYAVSNHYGTMEGGHYTAYSKSPSNGRWYKYDDHEVYEMSRSDIKSSAAYILYYTSIQQDMQFAT